MAAASNFAEQDNRPVLPAGSVLFLLDRNGALTAWTPGAEAAARYQSPELQGLLFTRLFALERPASGIEAALQTAERGGWFTGRGWLLAKDGARLQALL